jgi:hypothetical protein
MGDVVDGWSAPAARPMPDGHDLRAQLRASSEDQLVVGFDFPIGLPRAYAARAGVERFLDVLPLLGKQEWSEFFSVADMADEISTRRPFYPRTARMKGAKRQAHLVAALEIPMADLRRRCEQPHPGRSAACPLFWTVGGNQVGKGALVGWQMLQAHPSGAISYWPFEGAFEDLVTSSETVVVETYPAEFYGHLGLPRTIGKRRQANRVALGPRLQALAGLLGVRLERGMREQIDDGFGSTSHGEDAFDAFIGLIGMINVLARGRPAGAPIDDSFVTTVEGWILGQSAAVDGAI